MMKQRTLRNPISATGIGLHSGKKVHISLIPAEPDHGIVFKVHAQNKTVFIPARTEFVSGTVLSTTLAKEDVKIDTVEHLLSALAGLGIDNVLIELDSTEVPIMDGSANTFVFLLQSAGIREQQALKKFIRIKKSMEVTDGNKKAAFYPHHGFKLAMDIEFDHPVFQHTAKHIEIDFSATTFLKEISRARTFGFAKDIAHLRTRNLALGGSLNNAVVISDDTILNKEGLRSADEFIKHKVLDAIGDLYLLGYSLIGEFRGYKSGHAINNQLLKKLLQNPEYWEIVCFQNEKDVPASYTTT